MFAEDEKRLQREFYLAFWKAHILHHAAEGPVVGQWMLNELRRHGYDVSPGTLYPILHRMEEYGWLRRESDPSRGSKSRQSYYITTQGRQVLAMLSEQIKELHHEVITEGGNPKQIHLLN
jgi:PadR family transcriptional regulator, regulatory protein PadR